MHKRTNGVSFKHASNDPMDFVEFETHNSWNEYLKSLELIKSINLKAK
ncbi:hypothetical protein [Macrococcoides caseolyticum]|nr:hypothetical protein [Macrococcus caseolyticus]